MCMCRIRNQRCSVFRCASQRLASSPLSPSFLSFELPRYLARYLDIKGIRSLAWRRDAWMQSGCFVNCLSRCVPLCLQDKCFLLERHGRQRCTGYIMFHWVLVVWSILLSTLMMMNVIPKQNWFVWSLNVFLLIFVTVVCFCCQHNFHAQSGWRFQRSSFLNGLLAILEGVQWPAGSFNERDLQETCDTQLRERDYGKGSNGTLRTARERLHGRDLG